MHPTVRSRHPAGGRRGERSWWWSWTLWATAGETAGFVVPAVVAVAVAGLSAPVSYLALIAAGTVEGALLGLAQSVALCRRVPGISRAHWVVATACAAGLAWSIGQLLMLTDGQLPPWPPVLAILLVVVLGLVLVGSIGTAQWWVMRRQVRRSGWWILTTAGAWAIGLAVFTGVSSPLWQPGQPAWELVLIGMLGGVLMAATVAALTGWAFVRLTGRVVEPVTGREAQKA